MASEGREVAGAVPPTASGSLPEVPEAGPRGQRGSMWGSWGCWAQQGAPGAGLAPTEKQPMPAGAPGRGWRGRCCPRGAPSRWHDRAQGARGAGRRPTPPQLSPQEQNPLSPALWVVPAGSWGWGGQRGARLDDNGTSCAVPPQPPPLLRPTQGRQAGHRLTPAWASSAAHSHPQPQGGTSSCGQDPSLGRARRPGAWGCTLGPCPRPDVPGRLLRLREAPLHPSSSAREAASLGPRSGSCPPDAEPGAPRPGRVPPGTGVAAWAPPSTRPPPAARPASLPSPRSSSRPARRRSGRAPGAWRPGAVGGGAEGGSQP